MANRFTDTEIWEQDWFIDLPMKYKIFWTYIKDKCDNVGIWRPNKSIIQKIIGEPLDLSEFLMFVNCDGKDRILVLPNGRWFLKEYFIFQYGATFSPDSPVHRGALKRLLLNNLLLKDIPKLQSGKLHNADFELLNKIAYAKPNDSILIEYGKGINSTKDKDKDRE